MAKLTNPPAPAGEQPIEIGPGDLLPRLKDSGYDRERVGRRRAWVEEKTGASLRHVGGAIWDFETTRGNIENPIGVAQIPMGVAGPVLINTARMPMGCSMFPWQRRKARSSAVMSGEWWR